ncbi:MAG TPA: S41 family peptidase [Terriglobales bacterium]|jgi:carboxyl-terminal processing protease|nr:S41 family peptidase [Terriglobales bacterium]
MMSTRVKAVVIAISITLVLFMIAGGLGVYASAGKSEGAYRELGVYSEVLSRIRSEYVEEPNMPAVTDGALHGLLESLDPNSSYLSPEEYKKYKVHKSDGKADIGAIVSKRFGYAAIVAIIPGGPCDKAGIENGDILEAIEGKSTRELSLAEIHDMLSGTPGSNINFSVVRARRAEPQKITVVRDVVSIPATEDKMLEAGVGYVKVDALNKGKAQEVAAKVKELQHNGAKKLILDLRNVAEGEPSEGIAVANLFLNHGLITYLSGQKYARESYNADPQKAITTLPVVVLVNRSTFGAAEIVAAAVLDNARGDVLGDKTFGNGSVQKVIEIPDGSALILSIAKYYTPSGKAIEDNAVTPNILVASEQDALVPEEEEAPEGEQANKPEQKKEDDQLKRAVEVLKKHAS